MHQLDIQMIKPSRPEIVNFVLEDEDHLQRPTFKNWGWVEESRLIECLNFILEEARAPQMEVRRGDLFKLFGHVNKSSSGKPIFMYIQEQNGSEESDYSTVHWLSEETEDEPARDQQVSCYIPARWANNVIDLVTQGVVKVISKNLADSPIVGQAIHVLEGITKDGKSIHLAHYGKQVKIVTPGL